MPVFFRLPCPFRVLRPLLLVAALVAGTGGALAAPPSGAGWHLAWNDEFDGTTLDLSNWRHWLPGTRRDAVNSPSSVSVSGGTLSLTTYTASGLHYTGMISTQDTYPYTYGYIEARINYDGNPGMWSAFWMQSPSMGNPIGSPNSAGTEIDICEHRRVDSGGANIDGLIQTNIHWDGYGADHRSTGYTSPNLGLGTGWHTYGMEWTPTQQKFYIDGVLRWTMNNGSNSPVSQRSEFIILSSEVENGSWAGSVPAAGYGSLATSTTRMEVDYVRVWQRAETVVNGDFEGRLAPFGSTNQASWSSTGGRTPTAAAAARLAPTTTAVSSVQQTVRGLLPETGYTLTAWGDPGTDSPRLDLGARSFGGTDVFQTLTTSGYSKATVSFTTGTNNRNASCFASAPNNGSIGFADDFILRRQAAVNNNQLEEARPGAWGSIYGGAAVVADGTAYGGDYAWKIPASTSAAGAEQEITGLTPNTAYRLTGWTTNGGTSLAFGVKNHGGPQVLTNVPASTWTRGTVNFTTGASNTSATVFAYRASSTATCYADALFLSQPLTAPWSSQDVTDTPLDGIAGRLGSKFVMQACGADIGGTSDRMHLISQPVTGDTMITARLLGMDQTSLTAKTGVMIRESNSSFVRSAFLGWTPRRTVEFTRRSANSATATRETLTNIANPPWLRLVRRGNVFTPWTSSDGIVWSRAGTPQTLAMTSSAIAGLASCSGDTTLLTESTLDDVSVSAPGPDVMITSPLSGVVVPESTLALRLTATITDTASPTLTWSRTSGPGTVTFANPAAADTTATFSTAGTYVLRCTATSATGTTSAEVTVEVASTVSNNFPALYLKLDETSGTTATDSSNTNPAATAIGGLTWESTGGQLGGAAHFDGTSSGLSLTDPSQLDNTSAFTLSWWFRADTLNGAGLIAKRVNFNDNNSWSVFLGIDGRMNIDIDSNNNRFTSNTVFNRGAWYHAALVFDGSLTAAERAKFYVNGVLDKTATENSATVPNYASPVNIGFLNPATTAWFDGLMDEIRFHRRALSAAEIQTLRDRTGALAPSVGFGPTPTMVQNTPALFIGSASVDAGSVSAPVWTKASGPGQVVFSNQTSNQVTVTIDQPGTYVIRLSAVNAAGETSRTRTIQVAPQLDPGVFSGWQALTWPGETSMAVIGASADPDRDGLNNLLEWGLQTNAKQADQPISQFVRNGTTLEFIYQRRLLSAGAGSVFVEASDSLNGGWSSSGINENVLTTNGLTQSVRAIISVGSATRRFVRVKVALP